MIINVVATLECDRCKATYKVVTSSLSKVRTRARQVGWSNDGRHDLCPNCNTPAPRSQPCSASK